MRFLVFILLAGSFVWGQDAVTDIDGNVYQTVQIDDQLWMAENLKVTHYNNGDEIPTGYSNDDWTSLSTGAYAVFDDNPANADVYGNLYNWYAVDEGEELYGGICPQGWYVPTDDKWTVLEDFITNDGYAGIEGNALKEVGYEHWNYDNDDINGLDIYGFTGLPGGYRYSLNGFYGYMGLGGYFWSSTESFSNLAWYRVLHYGNSNVTRHSSPKQYGFSIRCLGD